MNNKCLHGVIVPVITPLNDKEDVDEAAFRKILRRLISASVHGIFVGGSAGEGPLLVDAEWRRMVKIALDEVGHAIPLLAGVMDTSTRRACHKIEWLRQIGYRYAVLTPTFYLAVHAASEHLRLFRQAKEAAGEMEIVAYNIPQCTGSTLAVETLCEMAACGWIRHCKDSAGDWPYLNKLIQRGKDVGLTVLAGDETISGQALLAGAKGIVPVCANYDPTTYLRLYEAGIRGDGDEVARLMDRAMLLKEHLTMSGPNWLAGIKYSVAALGIAPCKVVSPHEPANIHQMTKVDALINLDHKRCESETKPLRVTG
jgi:4-hydroxy-tetrahydrodipicolinate synthase